ncbi:MULTISPECIES: flagellar hook-associated protein FlgK [unclassified Devosia]|uniref:flagellar hook-associated protein FlgK n=1 Tax=unclassified Devosia TaxID=196773 RepID=UPI00086D3222|nr:MULTISPECIES: flagellar hook-associated protein FlgK [unclassified Devosia]MBN9363601.1 flagellar hook-associated protein FlgK [Devosia sp.]ODS93351.1 MAG: flagellar hook-associated protein FlgK [Devosia sp. SCN 66-27]OJX26911.1 MAG: flagellar hook-associated protein FlgK [Devosia sp. 66-14]
MGLSVTLSNALSGMRVGQNALDTLSNNVANAGTPGYHRRSVSVIDSVGVNSTYAREGQLTRTFNQSLQQHYTRATAESGFSSVKASFLDRVQTLFGKPGTTGSIDSAYNGFESALAAAATSPDSYANRADLVQKAQALAGTLNRMSSDIQSLRQETEARLSNSVDTINNQLQSLEKVNLRLADQGIDPGSRATLMDQRDRLVESLSQQMDLRVSYRNDGTVSLMTRSGVGILDVKASVFQYESAGALSASSRFSPDDAVSGVGKLTIMTPAGLEIDLVKQNVLSSGELAGLIQLRDQSLVQAQDQLDEIASSLAKAMSTNVTAGTQVTSGASNGYEVDLADVRNGNEFTFKYLQGGAEKTVRVMRVDDTSKLPLDYVDANGARVIGLDFSGGTASVAAQLQSKLGTSFSVSNPSGTTLRVMDDGVAGTTDMLSLSTRTTASGVQNGTLGFSLFVDTNNADFTDSLDGVGQKLGFAGRISVNQAVVNDNKLLVQYTGTTPLGDQDRLNQIVSNLDGMRFAGAQGASGTTASFRLGGTVADIISQTINFQGNAAAAAISDRDTQEMTLDALTQRLDSEYGVDVDEEMARLMELQNAFAANARVMSVVQELMDALMQL